MILPELKRRATIRVIDAVYKSRELFGFILMFSRFSVMTTLFKLMLAHVVRTDYVRDGNLGFAVGK